ncbi:MAG: M20/M25/M40 family metallo-hydrolase, partial [Phycisphaerales bacterium]
MTTAAPSARLVPVLERIDRNLDHSIARLCDFLRIPSVSTDPSFDGDVKRAAEWAAVRLRELGFEAKLVETPGHPFVVAHHPGPGSGKPILYYGHYDVQPPDPVGLWRHGAFEPTLEDGPLGKRVVARGACDDKGQVMTFIEAFRAWCEVHGGPPVPVTVMLEGEEESGSPSLEGFLAAHREALAARVCVVSDTGMWDDRTPAITTMLRGLVYEEVLLRGPSHDLHSGMYGGTLANPINALTEVLGALHDRDGRVTIPGFYDAVIDPPSEVLESWSNLGFDDAEFLASAGVKIPHGEPGRTTMERMWSRPTCDINGIWGGYAGKGAKTVIAAEAGAKLSCRLVAGQDPATISK